MRMGQQMKLAPRMIQSMEILQMPQAQLEERLEQELASNPTLELREPGPDVDELRRDQEQQERDNRENERELNLDDRSGSDDFERLSNLSEQYGEAWESNTTGSAANSTPTQTRDFRDSGSNMSSDFARRQVASAAGGRDAKMDAMANTQARTASLYDQLVEQWHLVGVFDERIERAGRVPHRVSRRRRVSPHAHERTRPAGTRGDGRGHAGAGAAPPPAGA